MHDLVMLAQAAWARDRVRLVIHVLLLGVGGVLSGVGLLLLVPVVNALNEADGRIDVPLLDRLALTEWSLEWLLAVFVLAVALQSVVSVASAVNGARLQQEIVDEMRTAAFDAVLHARWDHVMQLRRSDIVQVVTTGSMRAGLAVAQLTSAAVAGVVMVSSATVAVLVEPAVGVLGVVAVLGAAFVQMAGIRRVRHLGETVGERSRELQAVVSDSLDSLRLVRAHGASAVWLQRLVSAFGSVRDAQVATVRRQSLAAGLTNLGLATAAAAFVWVATSLEVETTAILLLLVLIARLSRSAQALARAVLQIVSLLPAVRDVRDLTADAAASRETPVGVPESLDLSPIDRSAEGVRVPLVELRSVTYEYISSGRGIADVSIRLAPGVITAVSGPSGAGKSTLVDVVLGLLPPASGEVFIDGRELTPANLDAWRRLVAYVPQETILFGGTLRDNLAWSVEGDVDDASLWLALDRAAAGFTRSLPDGLDTMLGDRGARLSGGERQRIAIARALLRQPRLLVFDEATSALDGETEREVLSTLRSLVPSTTVLIVAHRESTLLHAHEVIRLSAGRVVAS